MLILLLLGVLVLNDGDQAYIFLGNLDTSWFSLFELDLEHNVFDLLVVALLLNIHVILIDLASSLTLNALDHLVVQQIDRNGLFILVVVKFDPLVLRLVVLELRSTVLGDSTLAVVNELLSSNHAADLSIRALASNDLDVNTVLELGGNDLGALETEGTWEVLIKDSNLASGVISWKTGVTLDSWVIELDGKVKIWLPIRVINNFDLNVLLSLSLPHDMGLINFLVFRGMLGSSINGSNTEWDLLAVDLLLHCDLNVATALSDRVVQALETDELVLLLDLGGRVLDLSFLALDAEEVLRWTKLVLLSSGKPLEERIWLQASVKVLHVDLREIIGAKDLHEQVSNLPLVILWDLLGVLIENALGNLHDNLVATFALGEVSKLILLEFELLLHLFLIFVSLGLLLLKNLSVDSIGTESESHKDDEEDEGQPGLGLSHLIG